MKIKSCPINKPIKGSITLPGDKSISHRSIIIPSISKGVCEITNILKSDDVIHTLNAFKLMGVKINPSHSYSNNSVDLCTIFAFSNIVPL